MAKKTNLNQQERAKLQKIRDQLSNLIEAFENKDFDMYLKGSALCSGKAWMSQALNDALSNINRVINNSEL